MKVTIIEITEKPEIRGPKRKHRLEEQVREAACNCSEEVWIALLENAGPDAARALQRAMEALAGHGEYDRAIDIFTALYDIVDLDMPKEAAAIQDRPELLEPFMDAFLAVSNEFLDEITADEDEEDPEFLFEMDDLSD